MLCSAEEWRARVADMRTSYHGFEPIYFDVMVACNVDPEFQRRHEEIGGCRDRGPRDANSSLTKYKDVERLLREAFPSGVTPSGVLLTPDVIRYAAAEAFTYFC